jgi:DNA-binding NtrC family response regulator
MNRILVVDDERSMREFISILLRKEGHDVEIADSGDAAVAAIDAAAEEKAFDLVITDLKMPGRGGLEVLEHAKQTDPSTQVILMTAFATTDTALQAMKAGARDYIIKPFQTDDVLARVRRIGELQAVVQERLSGRGILNLPSPEAAVAVAKVLTGDAACDALEPHFDE